MTQKLLTFILIVVLLAGGGKLIKQIYFDSNDGFSVDNLLPAEPYSPEWNVRSLAEAESAEVENALQQPYRYLAKGHQSYVFESQDNRYVVKFLKRRKYTIHPFFLSLPLTGFFDDLRKKNLEHKERKRTALFKSWKTAFNDLGKETSVMMLSINKQKDFQRLINIIDKRGIAKEIDLGDYVFMIQRKVKPLENALGSYQDSGDVEGARRLLDRMLEMLLTEYRQGIQDKDHYLLRNTGVVDGRPVHMDIGRFVKDEQIKQPEIFLKELNWRTGLFKEWLAVHYPDLGNYFSQQLDRIAAQPNLEEFD